MTTAELHPSIQEDLIPALLEGLDPDAYIVITAADLVRHLANDWDRVGREHRGQVKIGWLNFKLIRTLLAGGYVHDTKRTAQS